MAVAIDASTPAAVAVNNTTGATSLTTAAFTPPAGSLILVVATADPVGPGEIATFSTVSGNTTAWTTVLGYNNFNGNYSGGLVYIGYAYVSSSVSTTVRVVFSENNDCQLKAYVLTGVRATSPINTTGTQKVAGNFTISYTAAAAGSMAFFGGEAWDSATTMAIASTTTDSTLTVDSRGLIAHQTTAATGATTQSFAVTATGPLQWAMAWVEVVPSTTPSGGFSGGGTGLGGLGGGSLQPNTLTLKINGVDRTFNMVQDGWTLSQSWGRQGDTATIKVYDEYVNGSPTFIPQATQTIELKDTTLGIILFGGIIAKPELQVGSPGTSDWTLNCVGYAFWADSRIVSYEYTNTSMGAIIRDLTTNAAAGITTNNVVTGPTITSVSGKFEPLSKAWSKITQMASTQTTYGWWVDGSQDLHVTDEAQAQAAGVTFTDVPTTSHLNAEAHYETGFKYSWDAAQLANRIYVIGGNIPTSQSDHWTGTGSRRSFALTYPYDSGSQFKAALKVGGNSTVISQQTTDPWYFQQDPTTGLWNIVASVTTNTPTPGNGVSIDLTYGYLVTEVSIVQNTTSISKYNGGNSGYYDATVADQNLLTLVQTNQRGQHEVAEYGYAQEQVSMSATEDWQGWVNVGQTITFISAFTPDSANSYINGLNKTFLIVNVHAAGVGGGYRKVQVQAVRVS